MLNASPWQLLYFTSTHHLFLSPVCSTPKFNLKEAKIHWMLQKWGHTVMNHLQRFRRWQTEQVWASSSEEGSDTGMLPVASSYTAMRLTKALCNRSKTRAHTELYEQRKRNSQRSKLEYFWENDWKRCRRIRGKYYDLRYWTHSDVPEHTFISTTDELKGHSRRWNIIRNPGTSQTTNSCQEPKFPKSP